MNFEKGNSYLEWKGKRLPLLERNGVYLVNLTDFVAADTALGLMDKDHEYDSVECDGIACPVVSDMQLLHSRLGHQKGIDIKFENRKRKNPRHHWTVHIRQGMSGARQ